MSFYPSISEAGVLPLRVVVASIASNPEYLNSPDCPYGEDLKSFLRELVGHQKAEAPSLAEPEDLQRQIESVIHDLDLMAGTLTGRDHSERLQYFKTKASLLEKLVNLKEKSMNMKEMSDFQSTILSFLDEICSKDQISTLMQRLRHLNSMEAR